MTEVVKKRKIAVECDTMLWDGSLSSAEDILEWMGKHGAKDAVWLRDGLDGFSDEPLLGIPTLEGMLYTGPGSLIVKGVHDEFWPVADGIHQRTYEDV